MDVILTIIALIGAVCWLPLSWRFFKSWQDRKNPVSLAISSLALFQSWGMVMSGWSITRGHSVDPRWAHAGYMFVSILVCILFFVAFRWSNTSFKEGRAK